MIALALHADTRERGSVSPVLLAVEHEAERARLAVEDLALASRGRRRRDRRAAVDVDRFLREQADLWRPVARAAGSDITAPSSSGPGTRVLGDRGRLAQITSNLIANALEHGEGTVTIGARQQGDRVQIVVGDEGPGPGTQRRRVPGGSRGHGLNVIADLARRNGGRLLCESGAHGSAMTVDLPGAVLGP